MNRILLLLSLPFLIAAKPVGYSITVPDLIYGESTTATLTPDPAHEDYVFVQCYIPDIDGTYVYAEWFPITGSNTVLGPIPPLPCAEEWAEPWFNGPADCTASQGWFRREGFGRYVEIARTSFHVSARQ